MSITSIAKQLFFSSRQRELVKQDTEGLALQQEVFRYLIQKAQDTEYGRNHLFDNIHSYEDFIKNVPINTYEELKGDIDRMRHGEKDILWPGCVRWYAKSSTTRVSLFLSLGMPCKTFTTREVLTRLHCTLTIIQRVVSLMARV